MINPRTPLYKILEENTLDLERDPKTVSSFYNLVNEELSGKRTGLFLERIGRELISNDWQIRELEESLAKISYLSERLKDTPQLNRGEIEALVAMGYEEIDQISKAIESLREEVKNRKNILAHEVPRIQKLEQKALKSFLDKSKADEEMGASLKRQNVAWLCQDRLSVDDVREVLSPKSSPAAQKRDHGREKVSKNPKNRSDLDNLIWFIRKPKEMPLQKIEVSQEFRENPFQERDPNAAYPKKRQIHFDSTEQGALIDSRSTIVSLSRGVPSYTSHVGSEMTLKAFDGSSLPDFTQLLHPGNRLCPEEPVSLETFLGPYIKQLDGCEEMEKEPHLPQTNTVTNYFHDLLDMLTTQKKVSQFAPEIDQFLQETIAKNRQWNSKRSLDDEDRRQLLEDVERVKWFLERFEAELYRPSLKIFSAITKHKEDVKRIQKLRFQLIRGILKDTRYPALPFIQMRAIADATESQIKQGTEMKKWLLERASMIRKTANALFFRKAQEFSGKRKILGIFTPDCFSIEGIENWCDPIHGQETAFSTRSSL